MSDDLLQEAMDYFPLKAQQRNRCFAGWRVRIKMLCQFLSALEPSRRESLFETASLRVQDMVHFRDPEARRLWFFSHPSYRVFEECLKDEAWCNSFADYIEANSTYGDQRHAGAKKRRLRGLINNKNKEAKFLALRYSALLKNHLDETLTHLQVDKRGSAWHVCFQGPEAPDQEAVSSYCTKAAQKISSRELWELNNVCLDQASREFEKIFGVKGLSLQPIPPQVPKNFITMLEVSDFVLDIPSSWKPISHIKAVIAQAMRQGTWLIFENKGLRRIEIKKANNIRYVIDYAALECTASMVNNKVARLRQIRYGLLPIGLKIHCAEIDAPGMEFLARGWFSAHNAGTCFNLPPVGNTEAVRELLDMIHARAGVSYLDNPNYQIQVCSPRTLSPENAALLGVSVYLGSPLVRRYLPEDFTTTHPTETQNRLIIYGAGVLDQKFGWWGIHNGNRVISSLSGVANHDMGRTDVLMCQSMQDIENVNLVATLLAHAQCQGYWGSLGEQFAAHLKELLAQHYLSGILEAQWVYSESAIDKEGDKQKFFHALDELMLYAHNEVTRIDHARSMGDASAERGILFEMQTLLRYYRSEIELHASRLT